MSEEVAVCKCGETKTVLVMTPELTHYGKMICADCGAFRKWAKDPSKPEKSTLWRWATKRQDGEYLLTFGKHAGRPISELLREEIGYMKWLVFKTDFADKCPELIDLIASIADEEGTEI